MTHATGHIVFSKLQVHYASATAPALDIDELSVLPGETVALVGASGSGKTTLINVLTRFVDVQSGAVYLDNHEPVSYTHLDVYKRQDKIDALPIG